MKVFDMLTDVDMKRIKDYGELSKKVKSLQKEIEELKSSLAQEKTDRQYDSLVHARELEKALQR